MPNRVAGWNGTAFTHRSFVNTAGRAVLGIVLILLSCIPTLLAQEKRFVFPDRVLPQIANGQLEGGQIFFVNFQVVSVSDSQAATVAIDFFDSTGNRMDLPFRDPFTGEIDLFDALVGAVPPRGIMFAETWPENQPVRVGYARVTVEPEGSATVLAIFNNRVPGERVFRASIPSEPDLHGRFFFPYTNIQGIVSSLAVVSGAANDQTVTFLARNPNGTIACQASTVMKTREHRAVILESILPCVADTSGVVEVVGSIGFLSGIGFEAADQGLGAFVTKPVYEQID